MKMVNLLLSQEEQILKKLSHITQSIPHLKVLDGNPLKIG